MKKHTWLYVFDLSGDKQQRDDRYCLTCGLPITVVVSSIRIMTSLIISL